MVSCSCDHRCPAVFHGVDCPHFLLPLQRTSKSMPEIGIEERVCHGDYEGGVIIFPRPHGVFAVGSPIVGVHAVSPVNVIPSFGGFLEYLCDCHVCSPLSVRGHGGKVAHIALASPEDSVGPSACAIA